MPRPPRGFTVRPVTPADEPQVQRIWTAGFLDLVADCTATLAPVITGGPGSPSYSAPRPLLAALCAAGCARAAAALVRREPRAALARALAAAAVGAAGLALIHLVMWRAVAGFCAESCSGDGTMVDLSTAWLVPGKRTFVVAVERDGTVLGCCSARVGDVPDGDETPGVCSMWRVSTARAARGRGVGRALVEEVERWAREEANATKMRLVTGAVAAKRFYAHCGYTMWMGSLRGASLSYWEKQLVA